jgi:hypothetical protein
MNIVEKVAGMVMGKGDKVPQSVADKRLALCLSCSQLFAPSKEWKQCRLCKCFVRAKVEYSEEYCPLKKW